MTVREYLQKKGYTWEEKERPAGLQAIMNCPFHDDHKKKFAINIETGAFQCFAKNECGISGSWADFQRLHHDVPVRLNSNLKPVSSVVKIYSKPKPVLSRTRMHVLDYFSSQGITAETVTKFRIGESQKGNIVFPYFKNGELVGVKYRLIKDKKMWSEKNQEPVLFNRDSVSGDTLIITEGEKDCMTLSQLGLENVVSVPNGVNDMRWIDNEWGWLDKFKKIYIVMDNDKAGREVVPKLAMRLGRWRCFDVILPVKDPNEYLKKYKDKAGDIINYFDSAKTFDPVNLVDIASTIDDVIELINKPEKLYGVPTLFEGLNKLLKGWRPEELTVWSGQNSAGKSTILNQVIIDLARKGEKSCIASMEMPLYRLAHWLVLQMSVGIVNEGVVKDRLNKLSGYLWAVTDNYNIKIESLIDVFIFAVRRYDVKHIFVDSLMKINMPFSDELKSQKYVVTKLVDFAKEYKCHVHLVAHPRKGARDNVELWKVDVSGTADITNLAHNVITLVRIPEDVKEKIVAKKGKIYDALLSVKKNREWGQEGNIKLIFDHDTKTYKEMIE